MSPKKSTHASSPPEFEAANAALAPSTKKGKVAFVDEISSLSNDPKASTEPEGEGNTSKQKRVLSHEPSVHTSNSNTQTTHPLTHKVIPTKPEYGPI